MMRQRGAAALSGGVLASVALMGSFSLAAAAAVGAAVLPALAREKFGEGVLPLWGRR